MMAMGNPKRGRADACYSIRKDGKRFYKFYLVNPKANSDIDTLAERLFAFKDVEEVYVTDGDHGFVVKTRFTEGKEPKDLCSYMQKGIDYSYGRVAHYRYRK